jgi:hypothetical protein
VIQKNGKVLWIRSWTCEFHKVQGIFWLAEELLDSQEEICSMELGKWDSSITFGCSCTVVGSKQLSTWCVPKNVYKLAQPFPPCFLRCLSLHVCNMASNEHCFKRKSQSPVFGEEYGNSCWQF